MDTLRGLAFGPVKGPANYNPIQRISRWPPRWSPIGATPILTTSTPRTGREPCPIRSQRLSSARPSGFYFGSQHQKF